GFGASAEGWSAVQYMHFVASGLMPLLQAGQVLVGGGGAFLMKIFEMKNTIAATIRNSSMTPAKLPSRTSILVCQILKFSASQPWALPWITLTTPPIRSSTMDFTTLPTALPITTASARAIMFVLSRKSRNSFAKLVAAPTGLRSFSPVMSTMAASLLERITQSDEVRVVVPAQAGRRGAVIFRDHAAQQVPAAAERRAERRLVAQLEILGILEVRVDREVVPELEAQGQRHAQVRRDARAQVRLVRLDPEVVRDVRDAGLPREVDRGRLQEDIPRARARDRADPQVLEGVAQQLLADIAVPFGAELELVLADAVRVPLRQRRPALAVAEDRLREHQVALRLPRRGARDQERVVVRVAVGRLRRRAELSVPLRARLVEGVHLAVFDLDRR